MYLVPAFAGLGAPHWDAYARGLIIGLTRGTTAAHIARAALEGIAYQVADVLRAMESDAKLRLAELRVDGGACANNLLMQFQADLLGVPVVRARDRDDGDSAQPTWPGLPSASTSPRRKSLAVGLRSQVRTNHRQESIASVCTPGGTRLSNAPKPGRNSR